jgi:anti-sigma regulatory factor (Ser/Thr protein kinase)
MTHSVFSPPVAAQSLEFQLASLPTAVKLARTLTREWFRHWRVPEHIIPGAELIASELVTNVVTKAKSESLRVRIRWCDPDGYIEVWDADPNPPVQLHVGESAEGGRGLFLVGAYATRWDYYPSAGGKVVWAEVHRARVPA